jgi:formylglycine-generating enzyme
MKRFNQTLILALVSWGIIAGNASASLTIDRVLVGNTGNANDSTGFGGVGTEYYIGKYEVTIDQYCTFLNAVAATDTYSLYNVNMANNVNVAGITRGGSSGSYTYSVTGSGNRPVTYVSWFDAARFVNWMNHSQPTGAQDAYSTEQGAYTLNGATSGIFTRNASMNFLLPTENEWYKAAYHQPAAQGGDADNYWTYATPSSTQPNSRFGSTTDPNSANFYYNDFIANGYNGGYAANDSQVLPPGNALTDAGAFTLADSFYGTYDQNGNVAEWTDGLFGSSRVLRGGSWADSNLSSGSRSSNIPSGENQYTGFRLVIIPEPGVLTFMALGIAMLAWNRKRAV